MCVSVYIYIYIPSKYKSHYHGFENLHFKSCKDLLFQNKLYKILLYNLDRL